jgi:hypothetical protein
LQVGREIILSGEEVEDKSESISFPKEGTRKRWMTQQTWEKIREQKNVKKRK